MEEIITLNKNNKSTIDATNLLIAREHKPDDYNIEMNRGEAAGQTVRHFHCYVIPIYKGDMENPRGGIRHCVQGKDTIEYLNRLSNTNAN